MSVRVTVPSRRPLRFWLRTLATTTDRARAERSWLLWGEWPKASGVFRLTPLGIVNGLLNRVGVELEVRV